MKTFIAVLKNDYLRLKPRIGSLTVFTVFTLATVIFAVYITGTQQVKAHVAYIEQSASETVPQNSKSLDITVLQEKPPRSSLVKQRYDAFVTADGNGGYQVETLRSDAYKNMLLLLLSDPGADVSGFIPERGVGVNIIGFMMMFVLMIAFFSLFTFADDKEQGQLSRIAAAPSSFGWYLSAHCVYCLSMALPEYVLLIILKLCGWNIGFSLPQYAGLLAVLSFLGIAFALLLNTLIKKPDNANMLGNSVTVLSSILAGSFYSFSKDNKVLDSITKAIPQKQFLDFAVSMQNGTASEHASAMLYTVGFALALFVFSVIILRKKYVKCV